MGLIPDLSGEQAVTGTYRAAPPGWSEFQISECETKPASTGPMTTFVKAVVVGGNDEGGVAKDSFVHTSAFARQRLAGLIKTLGLPMTGVEDSALVGKRFGGRCVHETFTSNKNGEQLTSAKIEEYRPAREPAPATTGAAPTASQGNAGAAKPAAPTPVGATSKLPF